MAPVFIIIPTYNERGNLETLVKKIAGAGIPDFKIIVVDDNSPDGTGRIAEKLAENYPLRVLHRTEKFGLGTAYVHAFKKILSGAFDDWGCPEFIIQMDADLSHDPKDILRMLAKARDCDLVLGSRYVPGGKIENWGIGRRLLSRFGNVYARMILNLPYCDLTGGFKCFKRHVLQNLDLDLLSSVGYNFQIETTYRARQKGYKICEIPITFTERKIGKSKIDLGIIIESFWKVLLLRFFS
ncbi:MAG: polyprenol monophosphomannose synthase [Patescibacteria group bacterium]